MTITTTANKIIFQGNGSTGPPGTPFTWSSFVGADPSDLSVTYTDTGGNQTLLATNLYTIVLNAAPPGSLWGVGGTLTYPLTGPAIATGTTLTLLRTLPLTQPTTISNQAQFYPQAVEQAMDQLEMQIQQLNELFGLAFSANIADATNPTPLPPIAQRANKSAFFDSGGNLAAGASITSGTIVSSAMIPVVTASTLALGRTAFGLGAAAVEGLGGLIVDVGGNLGITTGGGGVTTGMLQTIGPNTLLGNNTGATASVIQLTTAQVLSMLAITTVATPWFAGGCALSNDVANTKIDIASGTVCSDDFATMMTIGAFVKTTSSWAVNSGNGGLDTGTISASTWYHVYVIERTDTAHVDALISKSATSPTMPGSYTKKRRIGSFKTDGSSHVIAFTQTGNGNRRQYIWSAGVLDQNATTTLTTANRTLYTLASVPLGLKVDAIGNVQINRASSGTGVAVAYISSPDEDDNTLCATLSAGSTLVNTNGYAASQRIIVRTNTSQQFGLRAGGTLVSTDNFNFGTIGWYDEI